MLTWLHLTQDSAPLTYDEVVLDSEKVYQSICLYNYIVFHLHVSRVSINACTVPVLFVYEHKLYIFLK